MLRNKMIIKKIRNIFILLMAIIIMLGVYANIRNSRAENVIQVEMEVADKNNALEVQTIEVEATETKDGNYLLELPTSVNEYIVSKYYTTDDAEVEMEDTEADKTLRLTETEVANKKVQLQTDYKTKEVTTEDNQKVTLYDKEMKNNEEGEVIVSGYVPVDAKVEVTEIDKSALTNITLPKEEQTVQKGYEVSVYQEVAKTATSETREQSETETAAQEPTQSETETAAQEPAQAETAVPAEQEIEKVEYDASKYGETLNIKTKNTTENTKGTIYTLTEDNQIKGEATEGDSEYIEDAEVEKTDKTVKYMLATENIEQTENPADDEYADGENTAIDSDENTTNDIAVRSAGMNRMRATSRETSTTSGFLGNTTIQRQNIEQVEFVATSNYKTVSPKLSSYNVSASGNTSTVLKDTYGSNNGTVVGATKNSSYFHFDGVNDWINLGRIDIADKVTLEATISMQSLKSGEVTILGNPQKGGINLCVTDGKPGFTLYNETLGQWTGVYSSTALTVGTKTTITGSFDGQTMCLWVNGVLVNSRSSVGKIKLSEDETVMAIGNNPDGSHEGRTGWANMNLYSASIYHGAVWDVSEKNDSSIIAWSETNNSNGALKVSIASESQIYANTNASYLFANIGYSSICTETTTLKNLNALHTAGVTNMNCMFYRTGYRTMTSLDLGSNFYTSNVTTMQHMFRSTGYTAMINLKLGDYFDTSGVIYMNNMFTQCGYYKLTELNLGVKFDTRKVINMNKMFYLTGRYSLTKLDLSSGTTTSNTTQFNTSSVINMSWMFSNCGRSSMTTLNLGNNFDTSNVTDMSFMFDTCGESALTNFNIGTKFNTSKVTDMKYMFKSFGASKLTSLYLGTKFYTTSAVDMYRMFYNTGSTSMTSLDLGPAFTKIPSDTNASSTLEGVVTSTGEPVVIPEHKGYEMFMDYCGKSGGVTIYAPESIFYSNHYFKLNSAATTEAIEYTRGTINPKYRTEWLKESTKIETIIDREDGNKEKPSITITLIGTTNRDVPANEYTSNVSFINVNADCKIFIDDTDITDIISMGLRGRAKTTNPITGASDCLLILTMYNFEEVSRRTGKSYKEWSGNITVQMKQGTIEDDYGNANVGVTSSGQRTNSVVTDSTKVEQNTSNTLFADFVKPEFTYIYADSNINYTNKTLTVEFSVTDKYFSKVNLTTAQMASQITIAIQGEDTAINSKVTKTVTKISDVTETRSGTSVKIGEKYRLVIGNLQQSTTAGKYRDYSGPMQIMFPKDMAVDKSGNGNNAQTITIGINYQGETNADEREGKVVDVVNPEWKVQNINVDQTNKKVTVDIVGTDKYYKSNSLDVSKIKVLVDGEEATGILKELSGATYLTERRNGANAIYGVSYTLTLTGFEQAEIKSGKKYLDWSGNTSLKIEAGTLSDEHNSSIEQTLSLGEIDLVNPSWDLNANGLTYDVKNNKVTLVMNVTDKYFSSSTLTNDNIIVYLDNTVVTSGITKTISSATALTETRTVNGTATQVQYGNQYTITVTGISPNHNCATICINGIAKDKSGNQSEKRFVDIYNRLKTTNTESSETSGFLGNTNIQRQNIDQVEFVEQANYTSTSPLVSEYLTDTRANNNSTLIDRYGNNNGRIYGATFKDGYLQFDGVDDWVNLGRIDLDSKFTLDVTMSALSIKSGEVDIISNWESGGIGLALDSGKPVLSVWSSEASAYLYATAPNALTVGEKTRITGTYDGKNMCLYINGTLVATTSMTGKIGQPESNTVMAIGANPSGDKPYDGTFANMNLYAVNIYNDAVWDVSAMQNNSIIAWVKETNSNGTVKVNIASRTQIYANTNSDCLFIFIGSSDNCTETETIKNLNELHTMGVTSMRQMFWWTGYNAMTKFALGSNFDISSVTDMYSMFCLIGAKNMTSFSLGDNFDTSNVVNMQGMFWGIGRDKLTELSLGDKFNTSNVTNMHDMFCMAGYVALKSLSLGDKFDTSKVTDMANMFCNTGNGAMTSLDLGDKFDTSKVTTMKYMFWSMGVGELTSFDLGNKFYTSKVTDMENMFQNLGSAKMTSLDLGPAFTNIASTNTGMFVDTGKSGALVIHATESIFQDKNNFKLNSDESTGAINYTRGTIEPKYRTEWLKESTEIGTIIDTKDGNKEKPSIAITLRGTTNRDVPADEYTSDVAFFVGREDFKIFIDDTDITDIISMRLKGGGKATNPITGANDCLLILTIYNFEEVSRRTGKSYKEWSGNITVQIEQGTIEDDYGNTNVEVTSSGQRANSVLTDSTKADKNGSNALFADVIKPEFTYVYSSGNIDHTNKTLTVDFTVADKYFASSTLSTDNNGTLTANQTEVNKISVAMKDDSTTAVNSKVTKKITKITKLTGTVDGKTVTIGYKYTLVIGNIEQTTSTNGYRDYSGPMTVTFPKGMITDKSGNTNDAKSITIGINDPDNTGSQQVVDVVDPVWSLNGKISDGKVKIRVTDKYLTKASSKFNLTASNITVYVNDVASTAITKTLSGPTEITANKVYEYTLTLGNITPSGGGYTEFTPLDTIVGGKAKYRNENGGKVQIEIAAGAVTDAYGNSTKKTKLDLGNIDSTKPEIFQVQKTKDTTNKKETIIFNVTDKNYNPDDLITTNEMTVWMDGVQIDSKITKKITKTTAIRTTLDGTTKTVGHQYTVELSGFEEKDAVYKASGRSYREYSGTLQLKIDPSAAKDKAGNTINPSTTTIEDFVDFIKPEIRYTYSATDINKTSKTFTMKFEVTDKYYNTSNANLTINDLTIKIDGKDPDWYKIDRALSVENINSTINGTSKVVGKRYTLTLSRLEQLQIKDGENYLDYSGVISVAIPANKAVDTTGNKNNAITLTSGISVIGSTKTGSETVVDVVSPIWVLKKGTLVYDPDSGTATFTVQATDKYFKSSTLTSSNITLYLDGQATTTGVTITVSSATDLTETRVSGSTTTTAKWGQEYTVTVTGIPTSANSAKVQIARGLITDNAGNTSREKDIVLYNRLKATSTETKTTSGFLGNTNIQRQNIDQVEFTDNIDYMGVMSRYDAKNNKGSGHSDDLTSWRDLTGDNNGKLIGGSFKTDYLALDGVDDWVNLGRMDLSDKLTLDATITMQSIKSGEIDILANWEDGGVGLSLEDGKPYFGIYNSAISGYTSVTAPTALTVGTKTHITGTYDGTTMCLYINGKLVGSTKMTGKIGLPQGDTVMAIGCNPSKNQPDYGSPNNGSFANMNVYSVNIYNKALTAKEVFKHSTEWDVSAASDNSIIGSYEENSNGTVKVTIASNSTMFANQDSSYLFACIGNSESCTETETIKNLRLLNTKTVTNMSNMFYMTGLVSMEKLDLGDNFDTSNVTNMTCMFWQTGFSNMQKLELGENFDTSNVTDMRYMFIYTGRSKMTALNLKDKFNTSRVTNMEGMFAGTGFNSMTSLDLGNLFYTNNVTNMSKMFFNTGYDSMTSLDLGDKFYTTNVTDMSEMFCSTGQYSMTSLDLGDKFYTTNVTDMSEMFDYTGAEVMTSLDLGPAFTNIASENTDMFSYTGKSGALVISAPESIFYSKNGFKLSASATASAINYTRGTIEPKYRTEWKKESVAIDKTNATNPKIKITLRGTTNTALTKEEYTSDVTSSLAVGNIKVLIDGTDITSKVTKEVGTATQTTNSKTSAKDVLQTITLSKFTTERPSGKSFDEWAGNITVQVAQKTLKDKYGNANVTVTSAGARADNSVADTTKVSQNTTNSMFADFIKPSFTYVYSSGNIDHTNKTLTVEFSVTDKYFASTTLSTDTNGTLAANQTEVNKITVAMKDDSTTAVNSKVTKKVTQITKLTGTVDGKTVTIGYKYKLVIGNIEQTTSTGGYRDYSGPISITIPKGVATDVSGNTSDAKVITIGINEPDSSGSQQVVDVVDPVWSLGTVDLSAGTVKLRVKDKYLTKASSKFNLTASNITVYVNGVASTAVTKEIIAGPTEITANKEYEYTIKIGNLKQAGGDYVEFTPTETIVGGKAKYRAENGGTIAVEIAKGAVTDAYGNSTQKQKFDVGIMDGTSPEVYLVQKTQNAIAKTETIIFNVTDKNYDPTDLVTADEMTTWIDGVQVTAITKQITTTTAIKTTIDGKVQTVGHQYTVVLGNFVESNATFKASSRDYREYSGTLELRINANAAKDKSGNTLNTSTTTLSDFVDFIKPEIKYTYSSSDISYTGKTFTMEFDVMDKYLNTSSLSISDLNILIDGVAPNWDSTGVHGVTKTLELKESGNKTANINGTTKTVGKHYVLTLSHLEQLEKLAGKDTMDYSGVITVAIPANKVTDTAGNKNDAITLTSGISVKGGTTSGSSTVVDVVDPIWERVSSSASAANQTATITVKGTDKYFKSSSLTADKIKVFVNGSQVTSNVTVTVDSNKTDVKASDGVTKIGEQYVVKVSGTGLAKDAKQIKIQIQPNTLLDNSNNTNKATDLLVYNTLISTSYERETTSGFLGSANSTNTNIKSIQRQNIDNVTFVNEVPSTVYDKSAKKIVNENNTLDVSAMQDKSILAWYTTNSNGTLKVYIGSDYEIFGNYDSSHLFGYVGHSTNCTSTETITNIGLLNVASVVNMYAMFDGTGYTAMTKLDLGSNFDTSNVTNMGAMFWSTGYHKMTTLNLGSSFNTSKVTDMQNMFYQTGRQKLATLNLGSSFYTSKVTDMQYMFYWMASLTTLNLGNNFDTSNVTNMADMFWGTGYNAMTSLNLGNNFDTSNVTNMAGMFWGTGYNAMTSLNLGDKFDTSKVINMQRMFMITGYTAMTSLDLGPAFTNIASENTDMFTNTGKSGAITIHAPESIFYSKNDFKLSSSTNASAINYTRGTIDAKYRTEWKKESVTVDTTTASNPKINIQLRGTTNTSLAKEEYTSDVTSSLAVANIKILVDGTDITSQLTKTIGTATQTTNSKTSAKDVLQTITLSNFGGSDGKGLIVNGKSYREWSGNITVQVAQGTLKDKYGNGNVVVTSAGQRADHTIAETTKVSANTANTMFMDYIKPEIRYNKTNIAMDHGDSEKVEITFDVVDKYFASTTLEPTTGTYDASQITVGIDDYDTTELNKAITKTLTKVQDLTETRTGFASAVKIGTRYKLTLTDLDKGDGYKYSGYMTLSFKAGAVTDKSGNKSNATSITIGRNEPGGSTNDKDVVDVVDPVWSLGTVDLNAGTVELIVKDKFLTKASSKFNLTASNITVYVNGVASTAVTKEISGPTEKKANQEYAYTLKLGNITPSGGGYTEFTPTETIVGGKAKYRNENGGDIAVEIAAGAVTDAYGNSTQKQKMDVGNIDGTGPEVYLVQKTQNATAKTETIIFNVTDKNYDPTDLVTADEMTTWIDGVQVTAITKQITTTTAIKTTINGTVQTVGHQYTVVLGNFVESNATFKASSRDYREYSGTLELRINANAAKDKSGNTLNTSTTTLSDFVDFIKPEIKYTYSSSDISYTGKTFTMEFDVMDKYLNTSSLSISDLNILIDGVAPNWDSTGVHGVTKTLELKESGNKTANINGTTKTVGKHYVLTLSHLEQLEKLAGKDTMDYSGVITVAIPANKVTDTAGNKNDAITLTSGISVKGGTTSGSSTVVDVVDPIWERVSSSASAANQTATITVKGTDKYFKSSSLTADKIKVFVNGSQVTSNVTVTVDSNKTDVKASDGVTKIGEQYVVKVSGTGLAKDAKQIKIQIQPNTLLDNSNNTNKATDLLVYNTLIRTYTGTYSDTNSESKGTSGFLGSASSSNTNIKSIQRQNIDNITFMNEIPSTVYDKSAKKIVGTTAWDVSAQQDNSIIAWYTTNANGSLKVYIGSDYEIFGNYYSTDLFSFVGYSDKCASTETITNLALLNVGSVASMYKMFNYTGYRSMTKLDLGSDFDTSNVTSMNGMFQGTGYTAMTTLNLGTNFNTSKVTNMGNMFNSCGYTAMTTLTLGSKFNTSNVTTMGYMFYETGRQKLTTLNLGGNFDTSSVTNMRYMFYQTGRMKLTTLDLGSKFNTSKVTNMAGMFNWMGALKTLNLGANFDTSNVTNMHGMFWGTGNSGMTSFSLGTKFNTSKVENMSSMFYDFAQNIQTLDLGDLFYTTSVTDMANMFRGTGATAMTSLDLGPAFTQIPDGTITQTASDGTTTTYNAHQDIFANTGKSGSMTIHAPEAIFYGKNYFKYNADATASAINYTRGTINPKYRTEWKKESTTIDTTTASNPKIKITLRGTTNTELAKEEYTSDVTSSLNQQNLADNVKILIDGTDITSKVTKEIGSATQTTNATTGAKDVLQTITISKFEQARESGKSYKEWSGNITIQVAQKTLKDKYGNSNVEVTSAGARADNSVADTTKVSQNTTNSMFADFIKPEITYVYSTGDIDKTTKTLTVEFTVADKYFASTNYLNANGTINQTEVNKIEVAMKDDATTAVNTKVTKTLTKTEELKGTVDGKSVTIGYKFKLVIGNLEQSTINGEYRDYSGPMTIKFPKDNSADKSGNKNNETVITIGINEPDGTGSQQIVDVVDPIWQAKNINIDKTNKKVTVELWGTDKYYASNSLTTDKIKVTVDGEEATSVTKTLDKGTSITYGIKYVLTLTNFEQSTKQDGKDFLEWSGTTKIEVAKDTITDKSGNTSNAQTFELGHVDFIKPRIERVGSVKDAKAGTETITFNAIDKYMDTTSSLAASDIKVYVDKVEATGITKTLTKVSEITATVNNKSQVVGQQYQVVLSGFKQNRANIDSSKNYSEWSGTTSLEIAQGKIKDTTENSNDVATVVGEFVDYIAPEVTYKYASSDINYTDKTYVMEFEITDKYYDSSKTKSITSANLKDYLTIQIDGVDITNNSNVTKEIESVTDVYAGTTANPINKTVGGTVQTGLTNQLIGKHYKLKLSDLEQILKTGDTLDYSGVVTVAIKGNIVTDTSSNVNAGTTLTSGVDLPGGTSTGTVVDVVDPMWEQIGRAKVEAGKGNASMVIRGTDKYLDKVLSALTTSNSKVYVNGELPKTNVTLGITEDTSVSLDYGKQYKVSITGFDPSAYQVSLVIQEGALIDKSGNRSKEKEFVLFSSLAETTTETNNTSGFLGSASSTNTNVKNLQRKDIEQVVFEEYINDGDSTLWDVSALQDRTIMAWYEKTARNTYVVHIGSQIIVNANVNSTNLFRWIGSGSSSVATNEETNKIIKNIELLHTDNVTNMSYMFASLGTSNMTTFSVGTNFDTTRVTNMEGMFYSIGSNKMTSLDLSEKFETNNVQNMQSMFESTGYTALTSLNLGEKFDTSKVENMSKMFKNMGHNKMKSFDVGENFYVTLVTDMTEMFRGTGQGAMTALDLGVNFTRIADSNTNMFTDCGTSDIVVYAPELIYLNETTFKLGR